MVAWLYNIRKSATWRLIIPMTTAPSAVKSPVNFTAVIDVARPVGSFLIFTASSIDEPLSIGAFHLDYGNTWRPACLFRLTRIEDGLYFFLQVCYYKVVSFSFVVPYLRNGMSSRVLTDVVIIDIRF